MLEMYLGVFLASIRTFFAGRGGILPGRRGEDIHDPGAVDVDLLKSGVSNIRFPMV